LSLSEDGLAIFLTWFATRHPYWAAGIVGFLLVIIYHSGALGMACAAGALSGTEDLLTGQPGGP
jgi:hypothetical protein